MQNLISPFIKSQFPVHFQDSYPVLIDFMRLYFVWLEQTGNIGDYILNLGKYQDIDTTLDIFIQYFQNQYLKYIPSNLKLDKKLLLKNITEFYKEKGSINAYKFFFNILFGVDVELFYPKSRILRPSDSRWYAPFLCKVNYTPNIFKSIGRKFVGSLSSAYLIVDDVIKYGSTCEVLIDEYSGEFIPNEFLNCILEDGTIIQTQIRSICSNIEIVDLGSKFVLDTISNHDSGVVSIISGTTKSEYGNLRWNDGIGSEYVQLGALADVTPNFYVGMSLTFCEYDLKYTILEYYSDYQVVRLSSSIPIDIGYNAQYKIDYGKLSKLSIINHGIDVVTHNEDFGSATIRIISNCIAQKTGYYTTYNSLLNSSSRIMDSFYYQVFSYVIKSNISPERYEKIVDKVIHPVGTKYFSEVNLNSSSYIGMKYSDIDELKNTFEYSNVDFIFDDLLVSNFDLETSIKETDVLPDSYINIT